MLKRRSKKAKYAVGGVAGEMNELLAEGGMMDNSGEVVNGTEVPPGSLREEVADDVPALLSEGEFVVPADVVRYIGLEKLMKMRDHAKEGLERMEEMGQMGNAEQVANPDQQFSQVDDIAFENDIDSIMGEVDRESASTQTQRMFAAGGFVTGSDMSKAVQNPAVDVRYYKHNDGRVMYITHINDKPMTAVPDGFKEVAAEEARQVGVKAEERAQTGAGGGTGGGTGGGDGGGGDGGPVSAGDGGPVGIGPTGLAATGLGLMAASEALGKVATPTGKIASAVTGIAGKGMADAAISATTSGFDAMQAAAAVPGIATVSGPQGQVSTISSPATIAAADAAMFGTSSVSSGGGADGGFGFGGVSASDTGNIGFGGGSLGGFATDGATSAGSGGGADGGFGFGGVSASDTGGLGFGGGSLGGSATDGFGGGGDSGDGGGGVGDSGPGGSSGDAAAAAAGAGPGGPGDGDGGGGGGGGGGKIICTKLYELGLMDKDVYEADQAYGALVAAKDPALMNGYHYWANIVVDWMSGGGVRVIPFVSDVKNGAIMSAWATSWAQEIAMPWAQHMQYEMGQRKEDSKIGKALMTIGSPISRLFANRKERPSTLTAIGCIATFGVLYAFVKVAKLFTK
jgi:hypothetical protein